MQIEMSRFQRAFLGGAGVGMAVLAMWAREGGSRDVPIILYFMAGCAFLLASVARAPSEP